MCSKSALGFSAGGPLSTASFPGSSKDPCKPPPEAVVYLSTSEMRIWEFLGAIHSGAKHDNRVGLPGHELH